MAVKIWTGTDANAPARPKDYEITWEGLVLATGEINGYDDSDFYALVWDEQAGEPRKVIYATTRGWTYRNSATPDATDEAAAAYVAWRAEAAVAARDARLAAEAAAIVKGRQVEVVKGRKVPVGTAGTVIWTGMGQGRYATERCGIKDAAGTVHWTATSNCRVVAG